MSQSTAGGASKPPPRGEVTILGGTSKLVVDQVEIIRQRHVIKVPELVTEEVKTIKYIASEEPTVKYTVEDRPTVKYNAHEETTIKYNVREEDTTRYVTREVEVEKPLLVDKPYERPVIIDKEYTIVTFKDMELIRDLIDAVPKLLAELKTLRKYKLVEEVVIADKVQYKTVEVERVIWVDRERDRKTGELVDAN